MKKCCKCTFWVATYTNWEKYVIEDGNPDNAHGECHRYPPDRTKGNGASIESPWEWNHPTTWYDDWCGEFIKSISSEKTTD